MSIKANQLGRFITVEGIEGVGKTTNIDFIRQFLNERQINVITTREPGGTELAERCRELLLQSWSESVRPETELMLIFAARAQHISEVIKPALRRGDWVICDRFTDATFAYQGYGRGIDIENITLLQHMVQKSLTPDITILLDAPVSVGQQRLNKRSSPRDRFEQEELSFFERIRQGYLAMARKESQRFHVIDAAAAIPQVQESIAACIATHIPNAHAVRCDD